MSLSYKTIKPLLLTGTSTSSRWLSYAGLAIGVLLLLCSLQMFINIQQLLERNNIRKDGYDFLSITKKVTNENMGQDNRFDMKDIDEMKAQPFIENAAALTPNRFKVIASAGDMIPFSSDIFIEALDDEFIDTVPPNFTWKEGQEVVPVIFSSDFLEMYNVFAPSYGLPQLSEATASNVVLNLRVEGRLGEQNFRAMIVAFSDRVNSFLVPKTFLDWANKNLEGVDSVKASRVFIKTKDANNPELLKYLDSKNYRLNKEKTLFGRSKALLQGILSGLGIFGLLVVVLALMLFSFYLQLVVARSKDNLQLLLTLGYSPGWLSGKVARQFVPVYFFVVLIGLLLTQLIQWAFHHYVMFDRPELSSFVHWSVAAVAVFLVILSIVANYRMVRRLMQRLYVQ
ncbi:MAG TPA: FtsX-like permease family protein [Chitinophagaceae bacterium]